MFISRLIYLFLITLFILSIGCEVNLQQPLRSNATLDFGLDENNDQGDMLSRIDADADAQVPCPNREAQENCLNETEYCDEMGTRYQCRYNEAFACIEYIEQNCTKRCTYDEDSEGCMDDPGIFGECQVANDGSTSCVQTVPIFNCDTHPNVPVVEESQTVTIDLSTRTEISQASCGGDYGQEKLIGIWLTERSLIAIESPGPKWG